MVPPKGLCLGIIPRGLLGYGKVLSLPLVGDYVGACSVIMSYIYVLYMFMFYDIMFFKKE